MRALVGWELGAASHTIKCSAGAQKRAWRGEPEWGPAGLLRDLELRLGLPAVPEAASARVPEWAARIRSVGGARFYSASFAADDIGTAEALLAWRDGLIDGGWNGAPIPGGGDRLAAFADLERYGGAPPPGRGDRLIRIRATLREAPHAVYETLTLVEDRALWSPAWRGVFAALEELGTRVERHAFALEGAAPDTDLGLLQRRLRGEPVAGKFRADGSLLLFRSDTPEEVAELVAAYLSGDGHADGAVIVRSSAIAALEAALMRYGLPCQGNDAASACRPSLQILPLVMELAFGPRDPDRVLELLTLPHGPFHGPLGNALARAVSRQPGVGGQEWSGRKAFAVELIRESHARRTREEGVAEAEAAAAADRHVAECLARVAEWLEAPVPDWDIAPRASLIEAAERVRRWIRPRISTGAQHLSAAHAQATAVIEVLRADTRDSLRRNELRQILDRLAVAPERHSVTVEEAGRIPHVRHPSAILSSCETLVLWTFVSDAQRRARPPPWTRPERRALAEAGVTFIDPAELLGAESAAWRRAILAATHRAILVVPSTIAGEPANPHPLWDEIAARLDLDDRRIAEITIRSRGLLAAGAGIVRVENRSPSPLPEPRPCWRVPPEVLAPDPKAPTAAAAFDTFVTCPLSWVLSQLGGVRSGAVARIASGAMFAGDLGHRLIEELHQAQAFDLDEEGFRTSAAETFERLVALEGATLLLPGASIERIQLTRQILRAVRELHRWLHERGLRVRTVEEPIQVDSPVGPLTGRLDLRLVDRDGQTAVIDLKWGVGAHRARLEQGRALQLAAYARALGGAPAAYYALSSALLLAADPRLGTTLEGPTLDESWRRADRTANAVLASHAQGRVVVSGTRQSLPLLDAVGVPEVEHDHHYRSDGDAACPYCPYPAICGRAWEGMS